MLLKCSQYKTSYRSFFQKQILTITGYVEVICWH